MSAHFSSSTSSLGIVLLGYIHGQGLLYLSRIGTLHTTAALSGKLPILVVPWLDITIQASLHLGTTIDSALVAEPVQITLGMRKVPTTTPKGLYNWLYKGHQPLRNHP